MARTIFSGVCRIGRVTALTLGVAVMLAVVLGVATAALGANRLFVDGRAVAASRFVYDRERDLLGHTPARALGLGKHTVKVVATDAQGRSTTRQWSFKVV